MTQWKTRRGAASSRTHAWARLISQSSQYPTVPIYASYFTVGHGGKHDLKLTDALSGSLVCRLRHVRRGAALEVSISKVVYVNGKALDKSAKWTTPGKTLQANNAHMEELAANLGLPKLGLTRQS
uniref:Uncharacterized protein n=1 Tax=Aegilops tauschii TaxID=37682 RepID=M8AW88_AEGTA